MRPKGEHKKTNHKMTSMNSQLSLVIKCAVLAGMAAGFTGCKCCQTKHGPADNSGVIEVINPDGNSGSLTIGLTAFLGNGGAQQCFPTSKGWDKYYPMPKFFLGPNTLPDANCYTNASNIPSVTVKTCDPANGTTLETGIVIQNSINPNGDKTCATNTASCIPSTMLTIDSRSTANNTKYKATIFYKSSTLGSLTNVTVNWSYP